MDTEKQIEDYLFVFKRDIALMAQQLRTYLKKETKPAIELVGDSSISLNIGYGYTEKAWDCYCAIIVYSKHINISFPSGSVLKDPDNILHGTGKRIRHIKLKEFNDIKDRSVTAILRQARDYALELLKEKPMQFKETRTLIKQISGTKKRFT